MYNGNPYHKKTLRLREGTPRSPASFAGIQAIEILANEGVKPPKPKIDSINNVLQKVPEKERIKLLGIDYNSNLNQIPAFELFPNATHVHIAGRKIKKYDSLPLLRKTRHFFLCSYKEPDLSAFRDFRLESFRAIRGRIKVYDLSSDRVLIQDCNYLSRFDRVSIRNLEIECSQKLDLASLSNVNGMKELTLRSRKSIPSFDFLEDLDQLENLTITANNLRHADKSYLCDVGVPRMFLGVSTDTIAEIGNANHNVVVTNGDVLMHGGKRFDDCSLYWNG